MNSRRLTVARVVLTILSVLTVSLIFYNSSLDAVDSSEQSDSLLNALSALLRSLGLDIPLTEHIIRKTAHFVEYFVLGSLLTLTVYAYRRRVWAGLLITAPLGLTAAACDELIQRFSEGRSSELRDVLLDFSGVLCAAFMISLLICVVVKKRKEKGYE